MTDSGWRKRQIALNKKAENARELGLNYEPDKTITEMAREAGMVYRKFEDEFANANTDGVDLETIERFAELVRVDERNRTWTQENWTDYERNIAAAEREACAKVCDDSVEYAGSELARQIRARGQA